MALPANDSQAASQQRQHPAMNAGICVCESAPALAAVVQGLLHKLTSICSTLEETGLTQLDLKAAKMALPADEGANVTVKKQLTQAMPMQIVELCRQRLLVSVYMLAYMIAMLLPLLTIVHPSRPCFLDRKL